MEYLKINEGLKLELMKSLSGITNSGKYADEVIYYIMRHKNMLIKNEYVNVVKDIPQPREGVFIYAR